MGSGMRRQINGVNLGGWLVLEKWLTPSLFAGTKAKDEFTLSSTEVGRQRISEHRKRFITEKDIRWMAKNGVQAVRVPVGYWLFSDTPPYIAGTNELDSLFGWCDKYNIKILVCLHGAPGSQNGHDHSGRIGKVHLWQKTHRQKALKTLENIAEKYRHHRSFWGLEMLNEPRLGRHYWRVLGFYRQAYRRIRAIAGSELKVVFSDGYRPRLMSATLFFGKNAMMDIHQYHMATMVNAFSRQHMCWYLWRLRRRARLYKRLSWIQPVIIGEWTAVPGFEMMRNEGIRESDFWQQHVELQQQAFSAAEAIFYWTYKTEGNNAWNYRFLVDNGRIVLQ